MRILFVTGRFPHPPLRGDQARSFHQLRLLGQRHKVTLVTSSAPGTTSEDRRIVRALCDEVIDVPRRVPGIAVGLVRGLVTGRPLQTGLYDTPVLRDTIKRLLAQNRHDLVHVQLARLAAPFEQDVPIPRVLDLVDALSLNMERLRQRSRGALAGAAWFERSRLEAYERKLCRSFEAVTVVSEEDRQAIGTFPGLTVNGNGVDLERFPFHDGSRLPFRIVFTGNLGYLPNVDGATWLAEEILPRVRAAVPEATLELAGARPDRSLRALVGGRPEVTLAADIANLHTHLSNATVAVAPIRAGSGQLLKVLEAMASGTPLVATRRAASGLAIEDERHLLLADTPEAFADRVVRLLLDAPLRSRISAEARRFVESRHTWTHSVGQLNQIYESVLARSASTVARSRSAASR